MFDSIRIYVMASLGNFDLYQYEDLAGWKKYYGIGMHVAVLLLNMVVLVNLLIALMSDDYVRLSNVKTGLYWGGIISEMPKYAYDKYYGTLSMFPFSFSFISLLAMPVLLLTDDKEILIAINNFCQRVVYAPVALIVLLVFIVINLFFLPFAFFKTLAHKFILWRRTKGSFQCQSLIYYLLLGIPLLIAS